MNPDKTNIFIAGVVVAFLIYAIIKVFQWRSARRSQFPEPKRRNDIRRRPAVPAGMVDLPEESSASTPLPAAPLDSLSILKSAPEAASPSPVQKPVPPTRRPADWHDEPELPYADEGDYVFGGATPVMAALLPVTEEGRTSTSKLLKNAGDFSVHAWHNFAAIRYLGLMLPIIGFLGLLLVVPENLEWVMICGLVVGPILGWSLPGLILRSRAAERLRQIENGMPDMLDLMNMCVSQGMTVPASLGRVGRELAPVYPALSKELSIVNEQARIGSLNQALKSFSSRVDVPEVHSFASLLTQTERMGTSVSEALADYSDSMRESMRQRSDEKANTATFKLLFPTVVFLMPAVFLFLAGPAVIELNRFYNQGGADVLNATDQIREFTSVEPVATGQ